MTTEKLYYEDATLRAFTATVLSCEAAKNAYCVVLDKTAFYPEGGGQPCDLGTLDGVAVSDVQEKDGVILHTCAAPLTVGAQVRGEIDWARRFDCMQQHSGEHIVSGMLCSTYHCDNTGFHMGEDSVVIDYNADIPWEGVLAIERRANQYIWENHPFCAHFYEGAELDAVDYRSKKPLSGPVRITSFPEADCCACCGTHVVSSAQVGLVKFIGYQKFRDGVRLELLCGGRAVDFLSTHYQQNHAVAQLLSVKGGETLQAVRRVQDELLATRQRAASLEEAAFSALAAEYAGRGDVLLVRESMDSDSLRRLCDAVSRTCGGRCAVFAGSDGDYRYSIIHQGGQLGDFVKSLNATLNGRGGGRDGMAQGSVKCDRAAISAFFGGAQ